MKDGAKYFQLFGLLKNEINRGIYQSGQKIPGENELAEKYDMSRQTVRQALSLLEQESLIERRQGSGTYVRENAPRRKRSWNVGVMATYISEYIFPSILRGIESELSEEGFFPLLSATKNRVDSERKILEDYIEKQIDGLIVEGTKSALPNPNLPLYEKLQDMGIPVVFFNGYYPALTNTVSVTTDDRQGGFDAVSYLVQKGHRKIGGIFKGDDMQGLERYAGYMKGLLENGLPLQDECCLLYTSWRHGSRRRSASSPAPPYANHTSRCAAHASAARWTAAPDSRCRYVHISGLHPQFPVRRCAEAPLCNQSFSARS